MIIRNYEEVIEQLKPHLPEYLEEHGINPKRNFCCIHPDHDDEKPSMSLIPKSNNSAVHCFSCHATVDIFDACHYLEKKPKNGPNYISENVMYLAKKYGVEVELKELTDEEKYRIETFNAYKDAANYIATNPSEKTIEEFKKREWDVSEMRSQGVGSVPSFDKYKEHMKGLGYTVSFMEHVDLLSRKLFNEDNMIFTTCDEFGRPVGFNARNLAYTGDNRVAPKFINTSAKCRIFEKSRRLYNLHKALKETGTLYIVEGHPDVETMRNHGFSKVAGVGGTAFTEYHVLELQKLGVQSVTIVMDGDDAGIKSAMKTLDKFAEHRGFSVYVVCIPDEKDPDDFLRENGADAFRELRRWTAFEWKLNSFDERIEPAMIRNNILPLIVGEGSAIEREVMIRALSERTGFTFETIKEEVDQALNEQERKAKQERDKILKSIMVEVQNNPGDWRHIFSEGVNNLESISQRYNEDCFDPSVYIKEIENLAQKEMDPEKAEMTFNFSTFMEFNEAVRGNHQATLNVIGGAANCGKTALMSDLACDLAMNMDENNLVLFHTIDDTLEQFTTRLITKFAVQKYDKITLNKIKNPNGYPDAQRILLAREWAYEQFTKLVADRRIMVRGGENRGANTLTYAEEWIKYAKKANPDRRVVYFLDNFHRLRDFSQVDERLRFKRLSNAAKDMTKRYGIPMWATMEYNKSVGTGRPTNNSISESIAMEYDANLIVHLYNDLHVKGQLGEEPEVYFNRMDEKNQVYKAPRIEAIFGKNKLSSFKGVLYFDFFTDQSRMQPVSRAMVEKEKEANAKASFGK